MKEQIIFTDLTHTGRGISSITFPLGVSFVASNALKFLEDVNIDIIKYPSDLQKKLDESIPRIIAFSTYAWNNNLSHDFALRTKQKYPEIINIFEGPNYHSSY